MSQEEATSRGLRLIPTWLPVAVAVVTILCNIGATYATVGLRVEDTEHRLDVIEADRIDKLRDYNQFKADVRADLAEMRTDLKWIRQALEKRP